MDKCCWSECNNKAVKSLANNSSKGKLLMCSTCFYKYNKHLNAREDLFRREAYKLALEDNGIKDGGQAEEFFRKFVKSEPSEDIKKQCQEAIERIESGKYITEEEFFAESELPETICPLGETKPDFALQKGDEQ